MMDVNTGKTSDTAYAEVIISGTTDKKRVLATIACHLIQGRRVHFSESSYDALCNDLFLGWNGRFENGLAFPSNDSSIGNPQLFIGQKDLQHLLNVCRLYKVIFFCLCPYHMVCTHLRYKLLGSL
jgi:hypothetical protein